MKTIIEKICKQMKNDRRSLAMIFVIPLVIITFLYFLLGENNAEVSVTLVGASEDVVEFYKNEDKISSVECLDDIDEEEYLTEGKTDAIINFETNEVYLLENNSVYFQIVEESITHLYKEILKTPPMKIQYIYGNDLSTNFEKLSYVLLGIICFFLVFLIAGISFVRERTGGTLERFMLTPVKRSTVVTGYTIGFGIFGMMQAIIILLFVRYVLGVEFKGNVILAMLIMILLAFSAVSIGEFVSIFANSEFQLIQFIPLIIIPQIFFSGILSIDGLPNHLDKLAYIMPIYYGCTGLKKVLIDGLGFAAILPYLAALFLFVLVFYILNVLFLRKYRAV